MAERRVRTKSAKLSIAMVLWFCVPAAALNYAIYEDFQLSSCCIDTVPTGLIDAYVVVHDLDLGQVLAGWEMNLLSTGSVAMVGSDLAYPGLNFASFPSFVVGLDSPISGDSLVVASIVVYASGPGGVLVGPADIPSIPGCLWPVAALGSQGEELVAMGPRYGSLTLPQLWVGPGECPMLNEYLDIVSFEGRSFSEVKSLFR